MLRRNVRLPEAEAAHLLDLADARRGGAALDVVPLVQHPLQPGYRLRRVGGDRGGEGEGRLLRRGGRGDAVDQAEAERLVGADRARGEQQGLSGGKEAAGDTRGGGARAP